jgi:predicted transcriptional regulator
MKMDYKESILKTRVVAAFSPQTQRTEIYTVSQDENIQKVAQKITDPENREKAIAVTDQNGEVIGLVTEHDIAKLLTTTKFSNLDKMTAKDAANTNYFHVPSDEIVDTAIQAMDTHKSDHALILTRDKKTYIGWINRDDIGRRLREMLR